MLMMNILEAVATFGPAASPIYSVMIIVPSFALRNIAACHIYRKTKLGAIPDDSLSNPSRYSISSIRFAFPLALAGISSQSETRSMTMASSRVVVMESRDETVDET